MNTERIEDGDKVAFIEIEKLALAEGERRGKESVCNPHKCDECV